MNKKDNQRAAMIEDTQTVLNRNLTYLNPIINFTTYFTELNANYAKYRSLCAQQLSLEGNTDDKSKMKDKLVLSVVEACNRLSAFSLATGNNVLTKEINFSRTDLGRLNSVKLKDVAQAVMDRIQANLVAMAVYGASSSTQTALQTAINNFVTASHKPRSAKNLRKVNTKRASEALRLAEASLKKIDSLINMLILQQPDLYEEYWNARRLNKVGTRYASLVGKAYDAQSHESIAGVRFCFELDPSSDGYREDSKAISKLSAKKGGFMIKNMPAGIYTVVAKKLGFNDLKLTIVVKDGELTRVKIEMTRLVLP